MELKQMDRSSRSCNHLCRNLADVFIKASLVLFTVLICMEITSISLSNNCSSSNFTDIVCNRKVVHLFQFTVPAFQYEESLPLRVATQPSQLFWVVALSKEELG